MAADNEPKETLRKYIGVLEELERNLPNPGREEAMLGMWGDLAALVPPERLQEFHKQAELIERAYLIRIDKCYFEGMQAGFRAGVADIPTFTPKAPTPVIQ